MNFEYSEEQQQLADSVRKYLAQSYGFEARKKALTADGGQVDGAWATFAEMGLTAIPFAEDDGGFGGGAVDLMAAMDAFGEALVLEPLLDNVGLAGRLLARCGSAAQRGAELAGLIDGSRRLAAAYLEPGRRYDTAPQGTTATRSGAGWSLSGDKCVVIGAPAADTLVVSARTGAGASLFLVPRTAAGVTLNAYRTVDGVRAADVALRNVQLGADALLGAEGGAQAAIDEAVDFATALACADAVGAMKYACDATLEYLKTRKQFGVPIGSFQALQHRMVDMFVATELARSMSMLAATQVDDAAGSSDAERIRERQLAVSQAKLKVCDSARLVSQESVQLHGGMGMTEELKVSHTFRRLTTLAQRFGDADHHLDRLAALG